MIKNDDGGTSCTWNQGSRSAFPLSFLKIATRAEVSKNPATKERNCSETQESVHNRGVFTT
jgi:hypothetical protein